MKVSVGWRRTETILNEKNRLECGQSLFFDIESHVWMKLHCICSRSKQWTSQENWSITSSKPPKMYILDPTMHAEWPSRAPGKFGPLTSGVSHSRVFVSNENRISHTWTFNNIISWQSNCISQLTISSLRPPKMNTLLSYATAVCPTMNIWREKMKSRC